MSVFVSKVLNVTINNLFMKWCRSINLFLDNLSDLQSSKTNVNFKCKFKVMQVDNMIAWLWIIKAQLSG